MSAIVTLDVEPSPSGNLNLLSLDAGGPQGISQIMILRNVMDSVAQGSGDTFGMPAKRPCEVFHAIGGVGTGGLIAMFLVVLKMTAAHALEEFTDLVRLIFKEVAVDPNKQTEKLKLAIEGILERHGVDKSTTLIPSGQPSPACKLVVPIMYKNHVGAPCILRNYVARHEPPTNLTIAEAMLATCTAPPISIPTSIEKDFTMFEYVGGDVGLSNPTHEVIAEAHRAFGDNATVNCLLSIGSGHNGVNAVPLDSNAGAWVEFLDRVTKDSEKTAQEFAAQMKYLTLYHRLSVDYGLEALKSDVWIDLTAISTATALYLDDLEVSERVERCVETINHGDGFTTLEQLRHSGGAKVLSPAMPPLSPHYVERKDAMNFVEHALLDQNGAIKLGSKIIVVTGIGGCGKTQLIRKFVEQHGGRFATAFFVDGSSMGTFQNSLVQYVRSLGTAHSQKLFGDSMAFLAQPITGERLLVIDNLDDPAIALPPMLPRWLNGTVVITSRDGSRGQVSPFHLELDVMSLEESVELLVRGSGSGWPPSDSDRRANIEVAKELGCHPIALVQAISYMYNTGYSAKRYINRLRSHREPLLNNPAKNQAEMRYKTAFAAFDASYEILPLKGQKLLHLLSFFHWQKFCLDFVSVAAEDNFSREYHNYIPRGEEFERYREVLAAIFLSSGQCSPLELDSLIASLRNHSLITVTSTEKAILLQMHPLVHEWARLRLPNNEFEKYRGAAIRLLCCGANTENLHMIPYLHPHLQAFSSAWDGLHVNDVLSLAFILHLCGLFSEAMKLREAGCELLKIQLGSDHLQTVKASADLVETRCRLGFYGEAEELAKAVLRQLNTLLGVNHPDTIRASANLGWTYRELGRHEEAEELDREVLQRRRALLGEDHPDSIRASADLAWTYRSLGRYGEAEELEVEVIHRRRALLGDDHPDTIRASVDLAWTYHEQGRYGEAGELNKEVLRQLNVLLGVDHPDTIRASADLACAYRELGRHGDAEKLEIDVLQKRRALLGEDHPYTILAAENLACTYRKQGRYNEAVEMERDNLRRRTSILGERHSLTLRGMFNLAQTYEAMNLRPEAVRLASDATQMLSETLGETNLLYLKTSTFLASLTETPPLRRRYRDRVLAYLNRVLSLRSFTNVLGRQ